MDYVTWKNAVLLKNGALTKCEAEIVLKEMNAHSKLDLSRKLNYLQGLTERNKIEECEFQWISWIFKWKKNMKNW